MTTEQMSEMERDAQQAPVALDVLGRVSKLAEQLVAQIALVAEADAALKAAKLVQVRLEQEDLPELMAEVGLLELKLADGSSVEVVKDVACGLTEATRPAGLAWLTANGFGGLIKTVVAVDFARDEHDAALGCVDTIREEVGREATLIETVHPATLKSFIKEQLEAGKAPPQDIFGIFPFNKAKVTPPKAPKPKKFAKK